MPYSFPHFSYQVYANSKLPRSRLKPQTPCLIISPHHVEVLLHIASQKQGWYSLLAVDQRMGWRLQPCGLRTAYACSRLQVMGAG